MYIVCKSISEIVFFFNHSREEEEDMKELEENVNHVDLNVALN